MALPLAAGACAGTFRSPEQGGPQWVEVSSENFVVETDRDVEVATRALRRFEAFREALERVVFSSESQPTGRTRIVLFGRADEYREIAPPGTDGYFSRGRFSSDPEPLAVLHTDSRAFVRSMQHELVHRYVAFHFPAAPIWLNEGLADFYSTLRLADGEAISGDPPSPAYFFLTNHAPIRIQGTRFDLSHYVPPVATLTRMGIREFYGLDRRETTAARVAHYGAAWAVIHALVLGDRQRNDRFLAYLNLLKSGAVSPDEAWARTLRSDEPALDAALRDLNPDSMVFNGKVEFVPSAIGSPSARTIPPAEVHRLWAQIRPWSTPASRARAREDIDVALRLAPDDPKTWIVLGTWYATGGDLPHAETSLRRAVEIAPKSPEALHALAEFHFALEDAKPARDRNFTPIAVWVRRLEQVASTPHQWNFIAWYWANLHEPARGIDYARRAVREDSACAACYDTLALLLYQRGAVLDAVQAQHVAVNLSESNDPDMVGRLELFEQELHGLRREVSSEPTTVPVAVAPLGPNCEPATPLSTPAPPYPAEASSNDVTGVVDTRFVVREDGRVTDAVVISGPRALAAAALAAVKTWRFTPAHCADRSVASVQQGRVRFVLHDR